MSSPVREAVEDVVVGIPVADYDLRGSTCGLPIGSCVVVRSLLQPSELHPGNFLTSRFRYRMKGSVSFPSVVSIHPLAFFKK